jgi:hypothetical protein
MTVYDDGCDEMRMNDEDLDDANLGNALARRASTRCGKYDN